jgi:hypothetical protein
MSSHPDAWALRVIARSPTIPNVPPRVMTRLKEAGFIKFNAWPSGHWKLTKQGRQALEASR